MRSRGEKSIESLFFSEAKSRVRKLRKDFHSFCQDGSDKQEILHVLHTLKGSAAMLGLKEASQLSHELESLFHSVDSPNSDQLAELGEKLEKLYLEVLPKHESTESGQDANSSEAPSNIFKGLPMLSSLSRLVALSGRGPDFQCKEAWTWFWQLKSELEALSNSAFAATFVPFEELVLGLSEMVASTAGGEGKKVDLEIHSDQRYLLRELMPALRTSLTHTLSNAVVHGIESPPEREKRNKPPAGQIKLEVTRKRNQLLVTVADDGAGIDMERLRVVAESQNPEISWDNLSSEQQLEYLFQSGTSLAESITVRAGRGVGLAAVRESVREVGGNVAFRSSTQMSTCLEITFTVPMFMETCLEVSSGGHTFLIADYSVDKLESEEDATTSRALHLFEAIGFSAKKSPRGGGCIYPASPNPKPLLVDEVSTLRDTLVYPPPQVEGLSPHILGISEVAEGLVYVVDLSKKFEQGKLTPKVEKPVSEVFRVLVVDDSMTTRSILVDVLERAGYQVKEATNGAEALQTMAESAFQAVVCDLEMPEMNGLELLERLRRPESEFQNLPFLLFTSRDDQDVFEKAMLLGADRCLSKGEFDEARFLEILSKLLT